jgi:zinc protease
MKKTKVFSLVAVLFFIIQYGGFSQTFNLNDPIPLDPNVKIGKLDNGLTYYIQHNGKPEKRVELRLVINAGSICETDEQQGLAHLCEHMCFNGSKNFPGNDLVNLLESNGIQFGSELNAYTSFDETVYLLKVPTDKPELINLGFQVLEDWAHNVLMEGDEIDKERKVVIEEWRQSLGVEDRMMQQYFPVMVQGSMYAQRLPIGKMEVLESFEHETLRKFYRDWYRPNLMAVIVVGDIDPTFAEKKIVDHFSQIVNPVGAPERIEYDIPENEEPLVSIVTDKEAYSQSISIMYKYPKAQEISIGDFRQGIVRSLYGSISSERLFDLSKNVEAPFVSASIGYSDFIGRNTSVYSINVSSKDNQLLQALEFVLTENQRIVNHGFLESELERAKVRLLSFYESISNDAENIESESLINQYVNNFLEGEPIPGIENEYNIVKYLLSTINIEDINRYAKSCDIGKNMIITAQLPEKDNIKVPGKNEIFAVIRNAKGIETEQYQDIVLDIDLLGEVPDIGKIISRTENTELGFTDIVLNNGVRVRLKPTRFQNEEIHIDAFSFGGTSLYPDSIINDANLATEIVTSSGIGLFNQIALSKKLAGKRVSISPYISEYEETISGSSTPRDIETWLQLNYLYFTQARRDVNEFEKFKINHKDGLKSMLGLPYTIFGDSLTKIITSGSARHIPIRNNKQVDELNLDRMISIYNDRFADASDFSYLFVGNFNTDEILPLIEKYLGALPSINRKETFKDVEPEFPEGITVFDYAGNSEYQSNIGIYMKGDFDNTFEERMKFYVMMNILSIKLRETLRDDQGGVYGVYAEGDINRLPKDQYSILINWSCNPENSKKLIQLVFDEMNKLKTKSTDRATLNKIKKQIILQRENAENQNDFWMAVLKNNLQYDEPVRLYEEYKEFIQSITKEDIQKAANKYFNTSNYVKYEFMPIAN